jgi:putative transposase
MAGESELLKLRPATGRPGVIPQEVIAAISTKISEETCEFKSYKKIAKLLEYNYQLSVKYQTLHQQLHGFA